MILSHRAPSSLSMSFYRAIWIYFRLNFIFGDPTKSDPGQKSEFFWPNTYDIWSETGSYHQTSHGSVGAHIKTGRSPMAQDHF